MAISGEAGWDAGLGRLARLSGSDSIALQVVNFTTGRCGFCQCWQPAGDGADGTDGVGRCASTAPGDCLWAASRQPGSGLEVIELWQQDGCGGHLIRRGHDDGSPAASSAAVFEPYLPALRYVTKLAWRLACQARRLDLLERVIDQHLAGLLLVNDDGKVEFCNATARVLCAGNDGLALTNGTLGTTQSRANEPLQRRLDGALAASRSAAAADAGFLSIPRPSGKAAYRVVVMPLHAGEPTPVTGKAAAVLITDPSAPTANTLGQVRQFFGLTPREAELAVALIRGATVSEAAGFMGVSENTARVHLQGLFRKTGTHRQVDLLRALAGIPGVTLAVTPTGLWG